EFPRFPALDAKRGAGGHAPVRSLAWYVIAGPLLVIALGALALSRNGSTATAPVADVEHLAGSNAHATAPLLAVLPPLEKVSWAGPQFALRQDPNTATFRIR